MSLASFLGKHKGTTAWLFGKGPSLDVYLAQQPAILPHPGVIKMAVNEAALVIKEPDYFFAHDALGIERTMNAWNHGFQEGRAKVDPRVSKTLYEECRPIVKDVHLGLAQKYAAHSEYVFSYETAQMKIALLKMTPEALSRTGALYSESATIQSACHFAKLAGCAKVVLVGVDGGRGDVANVFAGMGCAKGVWYMKNRGDTHRILAMMGMPFTVWEG